MVALSPGERDSGDRRAGKGRIEPGLLQTVFDVLSELKMNRRQKPLNIGTRESWNRAGRHRLNVASNRQANRITVRSYRDRLYLPEWLVDDAESTPRYQ
jgi:hypothetical protein